MVAASRLQSHVQLLIDALAAPVQLVSLDEDRWDRLIRVARSARLLGVLAAHLKAGPGLDAVPDRARSLLSGAANESDYCRQMALYEMASVARVLKPLAIPMVLLKGAAYVAQDALIAAGRLPRDLDLLVPRARLDEAENALREQGWRFDDDIDQYDQHYYRNWTHELPPLHLSGHAFELDLHHTILPPIGRLKPDTQALFDAAVPVGDGTFRVLCPADQVLHASAHLFQDSDCFGRLRDLVDIDGLVREFARSAPDFWSTLIERALLHRLGRPLWYALTLSNHWLSTPVPEEAVAKISAEFRPPAISRWLVLRFVARTLPPVHPDSEPNAIDRCARALLEWRALWLRMPPWTLAYHVFRKALRSVIARLPTAERRVK